MTVRRRTVALCSLVFALSLFTPLPAGAQTCVEIPGSLAVHRLPEPVPPGPRLLLSRQLGS